MTSALALGRVMSTSTRRFVSERATLVFVAVFYLMVTAVLAGLWSVAADASGGAVVGYSSVALVWYVAMTEAGTISVGYSNRVEAENVLPVIAAVIERGAMYHRNASGALSLAYVAAGRLLGYMEEHMNAWDCLAGQLLVEEAGGRIEQQDAYAMIRNGGRVIAGTANVFPELVTIGNKVWTGKV